jgi:hypothetical protein
MRCRWAERSAIALLLLFPAPVRAQTRELGVAAIGTLSEPALVVAGGYAALRTSARTRITGTVGAGVSQDHLAWRGELVGHFLFSPESRRTPGFYAGGGVALVEGPFRRGYLVVTLGLEASPSRSSGWALEAGVGGGFRLAVGYRWRWFPGIQTQ